MASLCREAAALAQRRESLSAALGSCTDRRLRQRLASEQRQLQARLQDLLATARGWQRRSGLDPLGPALLMELCRRSLARV